MPSAAPDDPRACKTVKKNGERCKRHAIRGGTVCMTHGGASPQVRFKANERLAALLPKAVQVLDEAMHSETYQLDRRGQVVTVGPDTAGRTRAATVLLDRTGHGPTSTANVNLGPSQHLAELLAAIDDSALPSSSIEVGTPEPTT